MEPTPVDAPPLFFALYLSNHVFKDHISIGDTLICRKFDQPPAFLLDGGMYILLYQALLSAQRIHLGPGHQVFLSSAMTSPGETGQSLDMRQVHILARVCSVIRKL